MKNKILFTIVSIALFFTGCNMPSFETSDNTVIAISDDENLESCLSINSVDYAFIDGENRYGNSLETISYLHRRIVSNGEVIFGGIDYLFQCDLDGNNKRTILDQPIGQISFYNGWIYFSDCNYWSRFFDSFSLYRVRPDGSGRQTIYDSSDNEYGMFINFQIVNDRIYMDSSYRFSENERFGIQSMSLTGEDIKIIKESPANLMHVSDKVYYSCIDDIYYSDYDGANEQFIVNIDGMSDFEIVDGYIYYYLISDAAFYRVALDGGAPQLIIGGVDQDIDYMFIKDGYLYYVYAYLDDKIEVWDMFAISSNRYS